MFAPCLWVAPDSVPQRAGHGEHRASKKSAQQADMLHRRAEMMQRILPRNGPDGWAMGMVSTRNTPARRIPARPPGSG